MDELKDKPSWGADNNALIAIVAVNLVIAVSLGLMKVTYYLEGFPMVDFENEIYKYVIFVPSQLKTTWWTLFTFYWTHDSYWQLFTNLFWLFVFGSILQNKGANKHLFPIYFYSGLIAGLSYLLHKGATPFLGANTCVLAFGVAVLAYAPGYKLVPNLGKGIPAWLMVVIYLLFTGFTFMDKPFLINFSIILGGIMGLLYILLLKKEIDLGSWMHRLLQSVNNSYKPKNNA